MRLSAVGIPCPPLYLPLFLNDAVPEEHKSGIDMSRDLLRRSHVLVVCGHSMTESMKNDIAVAQRLGITATTLEGCLLYTSVLFPRQAAGVYPSEPPPFPRLGKGVGFGLNFLIKISEVLQIHTFSGKCSGRKRCG